MTRSGNVRGHRKFYRQDKRKYTVFHWVISQESGIFCISMDYSGAKSSEIASKISFLSEFDFIRLPSSVIFSSEAVTKAKFLSHLARTVMTIIMPGTAT